ncbi:hypothetical protein Q8A67_024887 [Cirrhinus molitorella]|uniref:Uncharacterized protein n=1 Tax=Cirrhinus molitorella TaxID=172907 RepID=A0AA88P2R4_9TELE|nr:hypothetical protein Q8A67_024887 [Cirrhinus molitorella]
MTLRLRRLRQRSVPQRDSDQAPGTFCKPVTFETGVCCGSVEDIGWSRLMLTDPDVRSSSSRREHRLILSRYPGTSSGPAAMATVHTKHRVHGDRADGDPEQHFHCSEGWKSKRSEVGSVFQQ